jgi:hypothetical protein
VATVARSFRDQSPSIAPKRTFLPVVVTVNLAYSKEKSNDFSCLYVPETIEWE